MNDTSQNRIDRFMRAFGQALGHPAASREEIIAEIRADLAAHIERLEASGKSKGEAVDLALAELGDPEELARTLGPAATPMQGPEIKTIRYIAAGGILLLALAMILGFRSGTYGWKGFGVSLSIGLFQMPLILLVWPGIIWRKNWLFGLIPVGIAVLIGLFFPFVGSETKTTSPLPNLPFAGEGWESTGPVPVESTGPVPVDLPHQDLGSPDSSLPSFVPLLIVLIAGGIVMMLAMQRPHQRRIAMLVLLGGLLIVEVPFQIEEINFRRKVDQARAVFDARMLATADGNEPGPGSSADPSPGRSLPFPEGVETGKDWFTLYSARWLFSGFALVYHSEGNRVEVRD